MIKGWIKFKFTSLFKHSKKNKWIINLNKTNKKNMIFRYGLTIDAFDHLYTFLYFSNQSMFCVEQYMWGWLQRVLCHQHSVIVRQYPSITRLPVHLENQQTCYYNEDIENAQNVLDRFGTILLTEWFKINSECLLKYMNFTEFYVWNKNLKTWTKRQEK